jgi:DNA repair photolyase
MPRILEAVLDQPPRVFTLQTRGPLILRDLELIRAIAGRTTLRVSFSLPTNRDEVLRLYEPRAPGFAERIATIRALRTAGIETYATLAPLLPCDAEELALAAAEASGRDPIGDPLHVRSVKRRGATTREAAFRIAEVQGHTAWLDPAFQDAIIIRIRSVTPSFEAGPRGFARLAA